MNIPEDIILMWPGAHASIPDNWVRETSIDGKYPKAAGDSVAPDNTGGSATHTHSSPSHTHQIAAHTHTYTNGDIPSRDTAHTHAGGSATLLQHHHTGSTGAVNTNNSFGSSSVTYGAVSNDPPFHELIFIKAQQGAILEDDIIALWTGFDSDGDDIVEVDIPDNYQQCDGTNGTDDIRNKYIKGAGTGEDAGDTGGSYTNIHDITHGHNGASHNHSGFTTGIANDAGIANTGSCCSVVRSHTHTYSGTDSTSITPDSYTTPLTTAETVEPAYIKVCAIQKKTGAIKVRGLIGLWLGAIEDIPGQWKLCDGTNGTEDMRDKFIKIANDTDEIGDTGGSNTHTHAAQSHFHTTAVHSHFVNETKNHSGISQVGINEVSPGNADDTIDSSTHGTFYTDNASPDTTSSNTTADESDNQPEYRTVAYIQLQILNTGNFMAFL